MREATIRRKTVETEISVTVGLDGKGKGRIDTAIPFFDHMLNLFARHGLIDLEVQGRGDTAVDDHHLTLPGLGSKTRRREDRGIRSGSVSGIFQVILRP